MSSNDPKATVRTLIEKVWNQGNSDNLADLVAPAYRIHREPGDPFEGKTLDHAAYGTRITKTRAALPDLTYVIEDLFGEDDKVAVRWHSKGTHSGDLPGFPATGKTVEMTGMTLFQLDDGKVAGHWQETDRVNMMLQLGLIRTPETAGATKATAH
ncbi:MAG: ester cyclase [Pseudomonadota bacterium]